MVEIADIKDEESLAVWLESKPLKISQIMVHRSAMRVLPDVWHWASTSKRAENGGAFAIVLLRANLIAEVVAYSMPADVSENISRFAAESASKAISVGEIAYAPTDMDWYESTFSLEDVFWADEGKTANAAFAANAALAVSPFMVSYAADSDASYNGVWELIRSDCARIMVRFTNNRSPLWQKQSNPFLDRWKNVKLLLSKDKVNWTFWIRWYEAALKGEPLNWEMLERIASIESEDWELGPEHVNGLIAEIEAEFISDALPQADKMDIDPATGLVEITPILTTAEQIIITSLKQVGFSYGLAKNSNCGLNFNSVACLYLEHTLENCRDDPNAILQNYQISADDIRNGLAKNAYDNDAKLLALLNVLEKEIVNLLANHPEVKKADRARIAHHLSLAKSDVKLKIVEELEFAKVAAGVRLEAEISLDAPLVAQAGESDAQVRATQRLFGRIGQWYLTLKNASPEMVRKIDAATGYKFTKILMTLGKLVSWITGFFTGT
mgnify:CR=1 FL=1